MISVQESQLEMNKHFEEPIDFTLSDEDEDWFSGLTCNPDSPEECESCQ